MSNLTEYRDGSLSFRHVRDEAPNPAVFKLHNHASYEVYYFISGKGSFYVEGSEYPLHSGDLLIMRSTEAHYISVDPSAPYERLTLHFCRELVHDVDGSGELLKAFEKREAGRQNLFTERDFRSGFYAALLEHLKDSADSNPRLQAVTVLYALLNEIRLAYENAGTPGVSEQESLAYNIISYVNGHLEEQLSLDDICARFFVSKAQLCRMFKKTTGTTVWGYVTTKRLSAARGMILSGVPATQAHERCGFHDYSAFYRAYRKQFGRSPTEERAR